MFSNPNFTQHIRTSWLGLSLAAVLALPLQAASQTSPLAGIKQVSIVRTDDGPCAQRRGLVSQSFQLATDHLYQSAASGFGYNLVPVFDADEMVTVTSVSCPSGNGSIRVGVRLASTGQDAWFEVSDWSEVSHFLVALPVIG